MNKRTKIFFIILLGLAIASVLIVSLSIKRDKTAISPLSAPPQEKPPPIEPLKAIAEPKDLEYIKEPAGIDQDSFMSGPLIY